MCYTYKSRFFKPPLLLFVHYYYEVLHGTDYIHTYKRECFRVSVLCFGNLKALCSLPRPIVDKLAMDCMFLECSLPDNFEITALETPDELFNYNESQVHDKMLSSPMDVGSVIYFFSDVSIVVNVNTSKEAKDPQRSPLVPTFAMHVANLFEILDDKSSTLHKENIALYCKWIGNVTLMDHINFDINEVLLIF